MRAPTSLTLAIGATETVQIVASEYPPYGIGGCEGLATLSPGPNDQSFKLTGRAVGTCTMVVSNSLRAELPVTVVATKDTETPLCTVPVGKGEEADGRALYRTEVDLAADAGTCAVRTATVSTATQRATIGFFSGSPGYSLSARFDYQILTAVPGHITPSGDGANLTEGIIVDATLGPRMAPDAGPTKWSLRFRMNTDPDPAKWTVTLFRFDKS